MKLLTLHLEVTQNTIRNALEPISSLFQGARSVTVNFEDLYKGRYDNLSMNASVQFNKNKHSLAANYFITRSKGTFLIDEEQIVFKNPRVSDHNFNAFWLWKNDKLSASVSAIYSSGKPFTPIIGSYVTEIPNGSSRPFFVFGNINSDMTDYFLRLDLSVGRKWILGRKYCLEIDLALQNALNRQNLNFRTNTFFETDISSEFLILSREINFLGRTPSIFFSISF